MKPKKYQKITQKLSQKNDWDEDLVNDVVSFFYKRVRKALSNLEETSVLIPKLGTFKVRPGKLSKLAGQKERALEKINPHDFSKYASYKRNKEDLEKLNVAIEKVQTLKKNKDEFFNKDS